MKRAVLDVEKIISQLTLEEKARIVTGNSTWTTYPVERLGVTSIWLSDGPTGIRKEVVCDKANMSAGSYPATAFPTTGTLANSFDKDLMYEIGDALGKECRYFDVDVLLAPGLNIKRNPLCGRNFEYFSEDPFLSGLYASKYSLGVQAHGVGVTLKHYAANNLEKNRNFGTSNVDEYALREIYLKGFEMAIKEAKPLSVMAAYNCINGVHASDDPYLLNDILRNEFGFNGYVVSDWGGTNDRILGLKAGMDLEMPGFNEQNYRFIVKKVQNGELPVDYLDNCVRHILNVINQIQYDHLDDPELLKKNYDVALKAACESAVLLKNDRNSLPLSKDKKYLVIGDLFEFTRYRGGGSSKVTPYTFISAKMMFDREHIDYVYAKGYDYRKVKPNKKYIKEAVKLAKEYDDIIYFGGLTHNEETEGADRRDLRLGECQRVLLSELAKLNKKITFVMYGCSVFEIPEYDMYKSMILMALGGEACGEATYKVLFGEVNPSGKLAETWVKKYDDVFYGHEFTKHNEENYIESIYVGYRYHVAAKTDVRFPFGYGLTYANFEYKNLDVSLNKDHIVASFELTNTSNIDSKKVTQIYIGKKDSKFIRPVYELKGISKDFIKAGASKKISIEIPLELLKIYSVNEKRYFLEDGEYEIYLNEDANTVLLESSIVLKGESLNPNYSAKVAHYYLNRNNIKDINIDVFKELYGRELPEISFGKVATFDTPIFAYKRFNGRLVKIFISIGAKIMFRKEENPSMFVESAKSANLRMIYASSGMSINSAEALLLFINNHPIKALIKFIKKS